MPQLGQRAWFAGASRAEDGAYGGAEKTSQIWSCISRMPRCKVTTKEGVFKDAADLSQQSSAAIIVSSDLVGAVFPYSSVAPTVLDCFSPGNEPDDNRVRRSRHCSHCHHP